MWIVAFTVEVQGQELVVTVYPSSAASRKFGTSKLFINMLLACPQHVHIYNANEKKTFAK